MTEILTKIMHLASGLFSIATSILLAVAIIGTGATVVTLALSLIATGLMIYGASTYVTGTIAMMKNRDIKPAAARAGLIIIAAGLLMLWLN